MVTKAQMRYEGTVVKLDRVERVMHLKDVRQFGTEGRLNGQNEMPARDDIINMAAFKIELVQNFGLVQEDTATPAETSDKPVEVSETP